MPNDDVRLAVVECLFNVPLIQFENEEINTLTRLMTAQNIGAGKTEIVLSKIFWILTKMVKDTDSLASKQFKSKNALVTINDALSILKRNQFREVDDEEEEHEKYTLSLSILNFLKHCSLESKIRHHLEGKKDILKEILFAEMQYTTSPKYRKIPIEIEDTYMGNSFDVLREAINGNDKLQCYNYVSFRILHQMADILQMKFRDNNIDKPFDSYEAGVDI